MTSGNTWPWNTWPKPVNEPGGQLLPSRAGQKSIGIRLMYSNGSWHPEVCMQRFYFTIFVTGVWCMADVDSLRSNASTLRPIRNNPG